MLKPCCGLFSVIRNHQCDATATQFSKTGHRSRKVSFSWGISNRLLKPSLYKNKAITIISHAILDHNEYHNQL